jgi:uncharacterized protein (DUF924 family)
MMVEKPSQGRGVEIEDFMFWFYVVIDVHRLILEHFGSYPHCHVALRRMSTEEEKMWLKKTRGGGLGEGRIREHV